MTCYLFSRRDLKIVKSYVSFTRNMRKIIGET